MFDIFMITYDEPNGDENWQLLKSRFPLAQRIHGVKGILNAHKKAAEATNTKMLWVIDGDSQVEEDFDFTYVPPKHQWDHIHVYRARNAVNGLVYGYGGIKLLPKQHVLDMPAMATDMTTTLGEKFKVMGELASITCFNSSPFNAWRGAFRECAKLSSKSIDRQKDDETEQRLFVWGSFGAHKPFGKESLAGAKAGTEYGKANQGDAEALKLINDFDWLKERFDNDN